MVVTFVLRAKQFGVADEWDDAIILQHDLKKRVGREMKITILIDSTTRF